MSNYNMNQHGLLPLLARNRAEYALAPTPVDDFDFAALLAGADNDYLGEDDSPSSRSGGALSSGGGIASLSSPFGVPSGQILRSSSSSDNNGSGSVSVSSRRQKLERRGHTKSRRGCYNCKRRRIKCQETHPACGHCVKSSLSCEYPVTPQITHQPQHQIPLFSLHDMRFFQHFLQTCFPTHPLGNESVWTHEVPCLAQDHEYLMHAILGLAASEMMAGDPSLVTFAMAHRLKAIKAIKKTLANVPKASTFEEGNALMATCFALTFQSVCLNDGMAEFMTFCRGIIIVAIQMYHKGSRFIFHDFVGEDQMAILQPKMEQVPPILSELTDAAMASLRQFEPLLTRQIDKDYHAFLVKITEALYTDSFKAYKILCEHYGWWMQIPHEQFQQVIDPANTTMVILAAHWIALKQIMAPITSIEHEGRTDESKAQGEKLGMIRWLRHLNRLVPGTATAADGKGDGAGGGQVGSRSDLGKYLAWPRWVEAQLDEDLGYFGRNQDWRWLRMS
ncbi:uncharacterized protein B0I36DRAFT_310807 [Microdochium trichocladiopsis]|uniref:Zn(2)-C6 fungal-type domain-containing protein n=1 Tax=Microdochium trichocladiopsis TaxID=1682393 RepID=A0A9P9BTZ5_9PEZI|nr:uncharacterized protein B0I36DRAFT_310807 [Microdochium trichocladiopsis]KAH7040496.1 hypothetical protein B0I36DRAFT_310807 [Microdochium trichocladiopsis]